jgi:hypothetical protein
MSKVQPKIAPVEDTFKSIWSFFCAERTPVDDDDSPGAVLLTGGIRFRTQGDLVAVSAEIPA